MSFVFRFLGSSADRRERDAATRLLHSLASRSDEGEGGGGATSSSSSSSSSVFKSRLLSRPEWLKQLVEASCRMSGPQVERVDGVLRRVAGPEGADGGTRVRKPVGLQIVALATIIT